MSLAHEKIQKELLDVYYGEKPMTEEIRTHLDTCSECAAFLKELEILKNTTNNDMDIEIDERIIAGAFSKASSSMIRRKNLRDFVIFAFGAGLMLGMVGLLIYLGYGKSIIVIQIMLMICVPLLVPFMIRQRLMKEEF